MKLPHLKSLSLLLVAGLNLLIGSASAKDAPTTPYPEDSIMPEIRERLAALPESVREKLRTMPIYMSEWHIWQGFPWPDNRVNTYHLDTSFTTRDEPWRININRNSYPLIGPYDSRDPEVLRWQARGMKAAGITAACVMFHPHPDFDNGLSYQQGDEFIRRIFDSAAKEDFPVFIHDEVQFFKGKSQEPANVTKRIVKYIKEYGRHPGYYRVEGKPAFMFTYYNNWTTPEKLQAILDDVQKQEGPVYWVIFGPAGRLAPMKFDGMIIDGSNKNQADEATRAINEKAYDLAGIVRKAHASGKAAAEYDYGKFENTAQAWRQNKVSLYGRRGATLLDGVLGALERGNPDALVLSSWSDHEEETFLEPAWDFDGFTGDPFLYSRIISALRGETYRIPAFPHKTALHPSIWEKLGYGDGAGPIIDGVRRSNERGGSLEVIVRDTMTPVTGLEVVWNGDLWWKAARPSAKASAGKLDLVEGRVTEAQPLANVFTLQIGDVVRPEPGTRFVGFRPEKDAVLPGDEPAIGVIYEVIPADPSRLLRITLPRKTPGISAFIQPADSYSLTISPMNSARDIGADAWEGWHARVGQAFAPIDWDSEKSPVRLESDGAGIAVVSLLGAPREERLVKTSPVKADPSGLRVTYYLPIPDAVLNDPALNMVWLRARDGAGNWGSPRLVAVPNYQGGATPPPPSGKYSAAPPLELPLKDVRALVAAPSDRTLFEVRFDDLRKNGEALLRSYASRVPVQAEVASLMSSGRRELRLFHLAKPLSQSFTLTLPMLHQDWERASGVFITNEAGDQGYGFLWDSGKSNNGGGEGTVSLRSLAAGKPVSWDQSGSVLNKRIPSAGRPATQFPLAQVRLIYDAAGSRLGIELDGRMLDVVTGLSAVDFTRLYLRGNDVLFGPLRIEGATAEDLNKLTP